uniref:Uncharacterized protein n=1 Tax=Cyclopterus lumpus TaxID=8103 RepID=A0A8C3AZR8_CYCLU
MHSERDVLVRVVFPELRRRAASHCLHLQEVELRWGVTEEESTRATELCLSEILCIFKGSLDTSFALPSSL